VYLSPCLQLEVTWWGSGESLWLEADWSMISWSCQIHQTTVELNISYSSELTHSSDVLSPKTIVLPYHKIQKWLDYSWCLRVGLMKLCWQGVDLILLERYCSKILRCYKDNLQFCLHNIMRMTSVLIVQVTHSIIGISIGYTIHLIWFYLVGRVFRISIFSFYYYRYFLE